MTDKTGKPWMAAGETDDPNAVIESYEADGAITKQEDITDRQLEVLGQELKRLIKSEATV